MPCLVKYQNVKINRNSIPNYQGLITSYLRLVASAALNEGEIRYYKHTNAVERGEWAGGIVGLKSILETRNSAYAMYVMKELSALGYITFSYAADTRIIRYKITDTTFAENSKEGLVRTDNKHGYMFIPRTLTDALIVRNYVFEEGDAWADLYCHTVCGESRNIFSFMMPCIQLDRDNPVVTLSALSKRWNRSRSWVCRFIHHHRDEFRLKKLPGSLGCVIFNINYPDIKGSDCIKDGTINYIVTRLLKKEKNNRAQETDNRHFCQLVIRFTRRLMYLFAHESRVADSFIITYIALLEHRILDCDRIIENTYISPERRRKRQKNRLKERFRGWTFDSHCNIRFGLLSPTHQY